MLTVGVGNAWGAEEVIYTLTPYNTGSDGTSTGYAGATDASCEDEDADITITWNVTGNTNTVPWRIGGKGGKNSTSTYDRVIYSKNAISNNVTKIVITHGGASNITVNSMTVVVSTAQNGGGTVTSTLTPTFAANGDVTINRPAGKDWSGKYYKIKYNVSITGDKNKFLEFSQAEFYADVSSCEKITTAPTVTATPGDRQIVLTWAKQVEATSYTVTCPGGTIGSITGTSTKSCTITGLTNGTAYTWTVTPVGDGSAYCESGNTAASASATPNVYYTVTWMNNGSEYTTTSVASGQKPVFPDTPTSCDAGEGASTTFYGWSTSTWSGKIDDISAKTIYTKASDMPTVTGNGVVYHAVFCKGGGGSVTLTGSDFHNQLDGSYGEHTITKTIEETNYTFTLNACEPNNTSNKCQMRDNTTLSFIQIPTLPGVITRFTSTSFTNASDENYTGVFHFKSAKSRGNANTNDIAKLDCSSSGISSLDWDVSEDNTTNTSGYLLTSAGLRMSDLTIYYGTAGTNYMTSCCTALAQVEGSVSWSQPTEAVVSWDNIDHVSSWTVKYKTHSAGAYSTWAGDQTTADGKRSVTITGLAACTDYDFQIIANPASGYCDKDLTIEDNQIHNWQVTTTGVTNATPNEAWPTTTCTGFSTTVTAAPGYDLPSTITVNGANCTWNQGTGALAVSNVEGDVSITLTPTVHTYSITYKDQGGEDFSGTQTDAPTSHTYGTATILKIPTKANHSFGGWFTSVDCTTGAVGDAESATLGATDYTADIVLYAKWVANQHTLTYSEGDAESGSVPAEPTLYDHGHKVTVLGNTGELVKEHYVFETWTDGENEYGEGGNFNIYDDVTLSPKWACNEYVNVSKGTPTNGSFELSATGSRYTCEGEEIITVTPSANTGYAFSAIEVTGVAGAINQTAKTVTYAQYAHGASTINVTFAPVVSAITWDLNYQGAPTASSTDYTYAGEALELPAPTRTGYDFVGWFTDPTDGSQIDNVGGSNKPYAATTYYAHWTIKNYTVTWKVAGNDYTTGVSASNNNANYNTTVSAPTAPAASLLGEQGCADTFMGWSKKNGGHDAKAASYYDDLFTETSPAITENTIFYAVFAKENTTNSSATFDASNVTATLAIGNNLEWQHTASGIKLKLSAGNHYTSGTPNTFTVDGSSNAIVTAATGQTITGVILTSTIDKNDASKHYKPNSVSSGILGSATSIGDNKETYEITGSISSPLTIYATTRQLRIVDITINYSTTIYSDYVTECAPLTCSVPQSLTSTAGKNGATISWSAQEVGTAAKYQYAVWADGEDEPTSGYSETTNLTAMVSGLMSDTEYNWKVRTVCTGEDGESEFAKSTFTTGSVDLTFSVPTGVSPVAASTSESALPSAGVPDACAGCWSFAGWSSNENATSVEYAAGGTYKFDGDKTLHAVYGKGSTTYERISEIEELATNENYIITAIYSNTEYALTSEKHDSYIKDAKSLDVTAKVEEDENGYYIQNPEANYIWKYTGTKLYNESANKYIQLSNYSSSSILDASGENLTFTVGNDGEWTIKNGSAYLRCYGSGFDASSSSSVYIYKRQMGSLTTAPDCSGHTVEWYVAGEKVRTDEDITSCDGVASLPSVDVADIRCKTEGTTFMGWSETNVGVTPTSDADEIAALNLFTDAADAPAITADKQFYAVFAEGTNNPTPSDKEYVGTITAKLWSSTGPQTLNEISWDLDDNGSYYGYDGTKGQQIGSGSAPAKAASLSTSDISGTITSVIVSTSGASDINGTVSVSVGGTNFTCSGNNSASLTSSNTAYTFTGSATGEIVISWSQSSSKGIYFKQIKVDYTILEDNYSYDDYFTECCPQKAITLSGVDDEVGKHFESDKEEACEGETVTLTKTENGNYTFGGFTVKDANDAAVDGTMNNVTGKYTFTMPETAVTVTAAWNPKNYEATAASADEGKGSVVVSGGSIEGGKRYVAYGSTITLTATPVDEDHYFFQNWTVTPDIPELDLTQNPLVITMPGNNIDVTANFGTVADPPALTLETNEAYTLTATLANGDPIANMGAIRSGTALKVSYVLNGQNEKTGWTLTPATTYGESENYITFNMPSEDLRVALAVRPYYTLGLSAENGSISSVSINSEAQTPTTTSYNVHAGEIVEVVAVPSDENYKFKEWVKTGDAATYSGASTTATLKVGTENMTLKAVFEAKATYNLTLNALGRTQEVIPALEGTDIASLLEGKNAVALKGYHFEGWSETEDGEAISDDALKLNGDKTVYAVYSAEAYYQKVTSTSEITDGQYLIVYEDGNKAFDGGASSLDGENNYISVTISNNKIASNSTTDAISFTIAAITGGYSVKSASNKYIGIGSDSNGLTESNSALTNTISIGEGGNADIVGSGGAYLRYNSTSGQNRFRYYKSSSYTGQKAIQLYKKVAPGANESNPTTVVANNEVLVIDEDATLNNLTIEAGGKVETTNELTVINNLTIESEAGKSGQVSNADNVHANNVYMDVTFYKTATELDATSANQWYMISAPFDVNLNGGFFQTDGTPMVFTVAAAPNSFDLFEYNGSKRASTGKTGWKRASGKMNAGVAYLIGFEAGQSTTIRLKAANTTMTDKDAITLNTYTSTIGTEEENAKNSNWNGVANPNLHYISIDKDAQTYDNDARSYNPSTSGSTSYVVGTAFFIHGDGNASIVNTIHDDLRAPRRATEALPIEFCVRLQQENASWANRMYIRASEEASAHYEAGRDLETMNGTNGNNALLWSNNYGMRLAIEEAPIVNDKASYALSLYAPANGTYRIETPTESDNADLYLTKDGRVIWNLSMGTYEAELTKGQNEGYGLLLVRKAPSVATGVDEPTSDSSLKGRATKVVIDEHVYILRDGQMYDVTGKAVK